MEYNSRSNWVNALGRFKITNPITPDLHDPNSYYQLIVSITKCENLSLGIFINIRERFQRKNMIKHSGSLQMPKILKSNSIAVCVSLYRGHILNYACNYLTGLQLNCSFHHCVAL